MYDAIYNITIILYVVLYNLYGLMWQFVNMLGEPPVELSPNFVSVYQSHHILLVHVLNSYSRTFLINFEKFADTFSNIKF